MIVIDASAAVDVLTEKPRNPALEDMFLGGSLHAPHLIDYEVTSALRGIAIGASLTDGDLEKATERWTKIDVERHRLDRSLDAILKLRRNFTAYDAAYVVLAKALRAPLVTADVKMLEAQKLGVEVLVF